MNRGDEPFRFQSYPWPLLSVVITTIMAIAVSAYYLSSGQFIVFQNLFYFPIIISCIYYLRKGFVFSVLLAFLYFSLIIVHTADFIIIREALIRVAIFILVAGVVTFISLRRRKAEEALRQNENKYRTMIENTGDLIYIADRKGRFSYINPTFERTLSYGEGELLGKSFSEIASPECMERLRDLFKRAMRGEDIPVYETEMVRKDGTRLSVEFNVATLYDSEGKPAGRHGIGRDTTDRKRAEEEREKIRSWRDGVNRILGSVLAPVPFDEKLKRITDGVIESFGADFCRIWIIEKGDLCIADCMHAEAVEGPHVCRYRDKCLHLQASSGRYTHIDGKAHRRVPFGAYKIGRVASGEDPSFLTNDVQHDPRVHDHEWAKSLGLVAFAGYRLKPPEGDTLGVFALFSKFPISPDMDAILEGLSRAIALVIQKDIAERALAENFKKRKELEFIVNHSPAVVWLWKAEENWPVEFVSENVSQFGYSADDFTSGRVPYASIVHPDDLPRVGAEVEQYTHENRAEFPQEYRIFTKSRDIRWIDDRTWVRRGTDGSVTHYQGIIVDISERKKAEEALRKAYKDLQETKDQLIQSGRLAALGQLASGAAHEIRNPLHIMSLLLQMLEVTGKSIDEDVKKAIDTCLEQIRRITQVLVGLDEFSRMPLTEKVPNDLNKIIDNVVVSYDAPFREAGITAEMNLEEDTPPLMLDRGKILLAIGHLVSNAVDAMRGQVTRRLRVTTEKILSKDEARGSVRIIISDTGHGIKEADMARIFDPFFTTKDPDKGKGLGLAISYGIIRDHSGTIRLENNAEGGATFIVELPVQDR